MSHLLQMGKDDLLLECILPHYTAEESLESSKQLWRENKKKKFLYEYPDVLLLNAGSSTDGLALDPYCKPSPDKTKWHVEQYDQDDMLIYRFLNVGGPGDSSRYTFATTDTTDCHPGFTRLRYNSNFNRAARRKAADTYMDTKTTSVLSHGYVSVSKFRRYVYKMLNIRLGLKKFAPTTAKIFTYTTTFELHGPALTTFHTHSNFQENGTVSTIDTVIALPCRTWPDGAREWPTRPRAAGWPTIQTIRAVMHEGCHVVPVSHPKSRNKDTEWRLSFSFGEGILSRSLTSGHRRAYLLTKLLQAMCFPVRQRGHLKSYHLKNVLFWASEKYAQNFWNDSSAVVCVTTLLNELLQYLRERNLPQYFIPDHNLIDTLGERTINQLIEKVDSIKGCIIRSIIDTASDAYFLRLGACFTDESLLLQFLDGDIATNGEFLLKYIHYLLKDGELSDVICLLNNGQDGQLTTTLEACRSLLDATQYLQGHHKYSIKAFMAMIHQEAAHNPQTFTSEELRKSHLMRTRKLFEEVVHDPAAPFWIFPEYYNFLNNIGEPKVAIDHYNWHVQQEQITTDNKAKDRKLLNFNSLSMHFFNSVNRRFQDELSCCAGGTGITVSSVCYRLYTIFQSYLALQEDNSVIDRDETLEKLLFTTKKQVEFISLKWEEECLYSLLGYMFLDISDYEEAAAAFLSAIEVNPENCHAHKNLKQLFKEQAMFDVLTPGNEFETDSDFGRIREFL